jgi:hypothetical protein
LRPPDATAISISLGISPRFRTRRRYITPRLLRHFDFHAGEYYGSTSPVAQQRWLTTAIPRQFRASPSRTPGLATSVRYRHRTHFSLGHGAASLVISIDMTRRYISDDDILLLPHDGTFHNSLRFSLIFILMGTAVDCSPADR